MAGISVSCAAGPARGCGRCCSRATPSAPCGGPGSTSISDISWSRAWSCARPRSCRSPMRSSGSRISRRCAVTGEAADLAYVSPKSGRAVSRAAGTPWQDKLLRLPRFLVEEEPRTAPSPEELADGLALTGFFLGRYVFEPRGEAAPETRAHFLAAVLQARRAAG